VRHSELAAIASSNSWAHTKLWFSYHMALDSLQSSAARLPQASRPHGLMNPEVHLRLDDISRLDRTKRGGGVL
jgi:hypothetical protein